MRESLRTPRNVRPKRKGVELSQVPVVDHARDPGKRQSGGGTKDSLTLAAFLLSHVTVGHIRVLLYAPNELGMLSVF